MLPSIFTLCALAALAAHIASLVVLSHPSRDASRDPQRLADELAGLLDEGLATGAVWKCETVGNRNPARNLALFMLGLELPSARWVGGASDYRGAPEVTDFEQAAAEVVDAEAARLRRAVRPLGIAAMVSGLVTLVAGVAALLSMTDRWGVATMTIGTTGAIGTVFGLSLARRLWIGPRVIRARLMPLLRPTEQMTAEQKQAAAAANVALRAPPQGARVLWILVAVLIAIGVAVGVAFMAPGLVASDAVSAAPGEGTIMASP